MSETNELSLVLRELKIHRFPSSLVHLTQPLPVVKLDPLMQAAMDIGILLVDSLQMDDVTGLNKPSKLLSQIDVVTKADIDNGFNFVIHKDTDRAVYDICADWVRQGNTIHVVEYSHIRFDGVIVAVCLPYRVIFDPEIGVRGVRLVRGGNGFWMDKPPEQIVLLETDTDSI